jgi:hypothetical protein
MDYNIRGKELVLAELLANISKRTAEFSKLYSEKPHEFGISRHQQFAKEIDDLNQAYQDLLCSYTSARRIAGDK